jgi:hypothetical protein
MGFWKRRTLPPAPVALTAPQVDRCQLCSAEICGVPVCALVSEDAVADAAVPGRRLVTACSSEHLAALLTGA